MAVTGLAVQATYVPCPLKDDECPTDADRVALLDEVGMVLGGTAVKNARALGFTDDMVLALLALAERGEKQLSALSAAADEALRTNQAPKDVVHHTKNVIKRAGDGAASLMEALEALPDEERIRVTLLLLRLANPGSRHVPNSRVRLAVVRSQPADPGSPIYEAESNFLAAVKEVLIATTDMAIAPESNDAAPVLVEQCRRDNKRACDGVLEIAFRREGSKLRAIGRLHFPVRSSASAPATKAGSGPPATKEETESVEVPSRAATPSSNCSADPLREQAAVAYALLRRLASRYAVLNELPYLGYSRAAVVFVPRACGLREPRPFEFHLDNQVPKPAPGFVFKGDGCPLDFAKGLRKELGRLPFFRDLTEERGDPKVAPALALGKLVTSQATDPGEIEAQLMPLNCEVSLSEDAQKPPYYAIRTYWQDDSLAAGTIAGAHIARIITGMHINRGDNPASDGEPSGTSRGPSSKTWGAVSAPPPQPLKGVKSNALWALASPGLPWLADGVKSWNAAGVALSASDIALIAGAAASYSAAAGFREQLVEKPDDPGPANKADAARAVGNVLVVSAGVLRLVALIGYLASPPEDKARQSPLKALAQPLTWRF